MNIEPHRVAPIQALAESTVSPKSVRRNVIKIAMAARDYALPERIRKRDLDVTVRWALNTYLDIHYFANFGRKKAIDKAVSKMLRGYDGELLDSIRDEIRREKSKKRPSESRIDWLNDQLSSASPGRRWSRYFHYQSQPLFSAAAMINNRVLTGGEEAAGRLSFFFKEIGISI